MINCRFIYKFKSGGTSDSLEDEYQVKSVPRVGDKIQFLNNDGNVAKNVVLEVEHFINIESNTHDIHVYYGDKKEE